MLTETIMYPCMSHWAFILLVKMYKEIKFALMYNLRDKGHYVLNCHTISELSSFQY